MRVLDVVVLADRYSPVTRAYLTYLYAAGFKPGTILLIDFVGRSSKVRALERIVGRSAVAAMRRWRRRKSARGDKECWRAIAAQIDGEFEQSIVPFGDFDFHRYSDDVREIVVANFEDPELLRAVRSFGPTAFLYTGGGIVGATLLGTDGVKVIHIHPGIVPDVRGADGILWSVILRGKPGYSGFYMNPGIDTGDVLIRKEYALPRFDVESFPANWTMDDFYRALLFSVDAHLRAATLVNLIESAQCQDFVLDDLAVEQQSENEGRTYFFMHRRVRDFALSKMLR